MDVYSRIKTAGPDEVLITVTPAHARRTIGVGAQVALAVLLIWFGFNGDGALFARIALTGAGAFMLVAARFIWTTSGRSLELTPTLLREAPTNRVLAKVSDVSAVERGLQVLKPSNGLIVRTKTPSKRAFAPGLWWRAGKIIAIGGMMNAGQGKAMAEILQELVKRLPDADTD